MKNLILIDTFGFFFRLYYALSTLKTSTNKPSGLISGFTNFLHKLELEHSQDLIIFALDSKTKTFRSELSPSYKQNRTKAPDELLEQIQVCIELIDKLKLTSIQKDGYEADDIIASIVKTCQDKDIFIKIITQDKDLYQLIKNKKVSIYNPLNKTEIDEKACIAKFGVKPAQIADYLALCGDSSDNIKGVKGIGPKNAKKLLEQFETIEELYENLNLVRNEKTKQFLSTSKQDAFLSKKLTLLYDKFDFTNEIENIQKSLSLNTALDLLKEYELNFLIQKLKNTQEISKIKANLIQNEEELFEILNELNQESIISFDTETTSLDTKTALLVGFSFCFNEQNAYYVSINHKNASNLSLNVAKKAVSKIFSFFVIGHNLKFDFEIIENNLSISLPKKYADTIILAWLYNASYKLNLDDLAWNFFKYKTTSFKEVLENKKDFSEVDLKNASLYACEDVYISLKLYIYFLKKLDKNLVKLAFEKEFEFIKLILCMQKNGIKLDKEKLKELMKNIKNQINTTSSEIYALCGMEFNINSAKQVGEVLFEKLNLPNAKKNKTGYKTDEKVLQDLKDKHEVIEKILLHRELSKLYSTYCEPFLKIENENSRIYSSFIQTGTQTGRLASKEPNLQNIPAHGQYAKSYKSCFIAQDGYSLISIDYSQIELRMLAHFSNDAKLIQAFSQNQDIHANTALMIFNENTFQTRSIAKSINFGLIYGMGSAKLAKNLNISQKEAKIYIEKYFENFSTVKEYFQEVKLKARKDGFIQTLSGRKRYFNFNTASIYETAMYERESINSILQGSAADVIKLAMLKLYKEFNDEKRLLLQIHDELIFEVKDELSHEFIKKASEIMENVVKLRVILKTSSSIAKDWGALK